MPRKAATQLPKVMRSTFFQQLWCVVTRCLVRSCNWYRRGSPTVNFSGRPRLREAFLGSTGTQAAVITCNAPARTSFNGAPAVRGIARWRRRHERAIVRSMRDLWHHEFPDCDTFQLDKRLSASRHRALRIGADKV